MSRTRYWTYVNPFLFDSILTFNMHPGEDPVERLCVFHELLIWCLVLMSTGEEWSNCFTLKDISVPLNPFIGLSAMTGDVTDAHEYAFFATCLYASSYLTQLQPLL